ncbi:MAG: YCF48-related protein [Candidatus Poribacteria bacterium]|nr:YCF48-related protein [Candidatus Poribacteria bacterium]
MLQRHSRVSCVSVVLIIALFIIGCEDITSKEQRRYRWKTVMEGDWSSHLYDVHFVNENIGWAVGNAVDLIPSLDREEGAESLIIHTKNGGQTWHRQSSSAFGRPLRNVYFRSALEGWCTGEGGVLIHTTDGGKTWQHIETGTENNLHDLFIGEATGWIVGDWGTLLKTTDGGQTFTKIDGKVFNRKSLKGVHFVSENLGWIITYNTPTSTNNENAGYIYQTTDGGETWHAQFETEAALFNLHFTDEQTGWVVGDRRSVFATTDGGETWEFITHGTNERHKSSYGQPEYLGKEPLHTFTLYDIDFTDTQNGWIVGDLGVILHTSSGGKGKWKHQRGGPRFHNSADAVLLGIDFVSKQLGWAVGENGTILHTRNGGVTWESQSSPSHLLVGVCATSSKEGYVVGDRGSILRTEDGGVVWDAQDSRTTECFGATHFVSAQVGWAVAEAGVVLHTANGGSVWQRQTSGTEQDLLSLFFVDEENGWCVGSGGEIIHTNDGGKTWNRQKSGTTWNLFDVHFTSKQRGWVVGMNGTMLSTVDGGTNWKLASISRRHPFFFLDAVTFVSPEIGWVVGLDLRSLGMDGLILHTENGGKTWQRQESHTANFLDDVFFISETEGWIVGKEGLVLHTKDGGQNWRPQHTETRTDLKAIYISSRDSGWVVGQNGTILRYEAVP